MTGRIATCLWFNGRAEEAARFYVSLLGGSIDAISRYPAEPPPQAPFPGGTEMLVEFTVMGQRFQILNGGPHFTLDEAASMCLTCKDQAELDARFDALTAEGGSDGPCGWLKDRFGLSWQLVPEAMLDMQKSGDGAGVQRMMDAMMGMRKLDIAALTAAFQGERA